MTEHTPTPWHYEFGPDTVLHQVHVPAAIMGPDNHGIPHAMVYDDLKQGGTIIANAAFIVTACNSHDALLDACKEALCCFTEPGPVADQLVAAIAAAEDKPNKAGQHG